MVNGASRVCRFFRVLWGLRFLALVVLVLVLSKRPYWTAFCLAIYIVVAACRVHAKDLWRIIGPARSDSLEEGGKAFGRIERFLLGVAYLGWVAWMISGPIEQPFWMVFVAVLSFALISSALGIWWLTLWAIQKDARWGQFGIGSLLFLTVFVAIYCGAVRWFVNLAPGPALPSWHQWVFLFLVALILFFLSIPFVLFASEALVWAAVWLVKRPGVRRLFARRGPNP